MSCGINQKVMWVMCIWEFPQVFQLGEIFHWSVGRAVENSHNLLVKTIPGSIILLVFGEVGIEVPPLGCLKQRWWFFSCFFNWNVLSLYKISLPEKRVVQWMIASDVKSEMWYLLFSYYHLSWPHIPSCFQLASPLALLLVWRCNVWYHVAVWTSDVFIFLECWWILGTENAENQHVSYVIWCHMPFDRVFWAHLWMGKKWNCLFGGSPGLLLCTVKLLEWSNWTSFQVWCCRASGFLMFYNFLMISCCDYF